MSADEATSFEFEAALSFAGEDREYVEEVAAALKAAHIEVFLDSDHLAAMWGEDLVEFFDGVYRKRSRYAVLFISRHYAEKVWTRHERRSALARALNEKAAYVLPIRLDDTQLDGLRPTVHYLDARRIGIDGIVKTLGAKLAGAVGGLESWPGDRTPRTDRELTQLLALRPGGWEYLYLGGCLRVQLDDLAAKYRDHELRYPSRTGGRVTMDDAIDYLKRALDEIQGLVASMMGLFTATAQERAFGRPGEPGDAERIHHLAMRLTSGYEELIDWAARVRGVVRPSEVADLFELLARFADVPIEEYREFVTAATEQFDRIPAAVAANEPLVMTVTLTVTIDESASEAFTQELHRVFGESDDEFDQI